MSPASWHQNLTMEVLDLEEHRETPADAPQGSGTLSAGLCRAARTPAGSGQMERLTPEARKEERLDTQEGEWQRPQMPKEAGLQQVCMWSTSRFASYRPAFWYQTERQSQLSNPAGQLYERAFIILQPRESIYPQDVIALH